MGALLEKVRSITQKEGKYTFKDEREQGQYLKEVTNDFQAIRRRMKKRGDWDGYVFSASRPDRFTALIRICHLIKDRRVLWGLLGHIWTDSESTRQDRRYWESWLRSAEPDAKHFMSEEDQRAFEALPNTLTIYRGCLKGLNEDGLSWTLSRERAEWFSKRFACLHPNNPPLVLERRIKKRDAFALMTDRQEDEIVLRPAQ